jgi:hypothetical protein
LAFGYGNGVFLFLFFQFFHAKKNEKLLEKVRIQWNVHLKDKKFQNIPNFFVRKDHKICPKDKKSTEGKRAKHGASHLNKLRRGISSL